MTKQIVKDKNNKTLGVMLFLTEEEANIFEDYIDDMTHYESDLLAVKEAKKDNEFLDGENSFKEIMSGNTNETNKRWKWNKMKVKQALKNVITRFMGQETVKVTIYSKSYRE